MSRLNFSDKPSTTISLKPPYCVVNLDKSCEHSVRDAKYCAKNGVFFDLQLKLSSVGEDGEDRTYFDFRDPRASLLYHEIVRIYKLANQTLDLVVKFSVLEDSSSTHQGNITVQEMWLDSNVYFYNAGRAEIGIRVDGKEQRLKKGDYLPLVHADQKDAWKRKPNGTSPAARRPA